MIPQRLDDTTTFACMDSIGAGDRHISWDCTAVRPRHISSLISGSRYRFLFLPYSPRSSPRVSIRWHLLLNMGDGRRETGGGLGGTGKQETRDMGRIGRYSRSGHINLAWLNVINYHLSRLVGCIAFFIYIFLKNENTAIFHIKQLSRRDSHRFLIM
ncbi:hypothetical protein F4781DRAFT_56337 [Annulohypoxylon bovei var. microspora]|nr:hypothetical protein F4781DRAFT_56337 [Annulohypoxylon bovei var. microspora]